MAIDPESLKPKPHKDIDKIAADILGYPLDKPQGEPPQFYPVKKTTEDSFNNAMMGAIRSADRIIKTRSIPLELRADEPVDPKSPEEIPNTAQQDLAHSATLVQNFQIILQSAATTNAIANQDRTILAKTALPLIETMAKAETETAAEFLNPSQVNAAYDPELTGNVFASAQRAYIPPDPESAAYHDLRATNLREGVVPLVQELARALNIPLTPAERKR